MKRHQELLTEAIERDGVAQRALFAGDRAAARDAFAEAADLYRRSWELAPPTSYGRLIGMLKAAVLAGDGADHARYVRAALAEDESDSPAAAYARALAGLIAGDDQAAHGFSQAMRTGSEAFGRTADAIAALSTGDRVGYGAAVAQIVRDFELRSEHLTGVAIADTALVLERLAAGKGLAAGISSRVLPAM